MNTSYLKNTNGLFKDITSKDNLRTMVSYSNKPLHPDTIFSGTYAKFFFLIRLSKLGQLQINKDLNKKLLQKDIKNLITPRVGIDFDFIDVLFNMIHKAYNSEDGMIKGLPSNVLLLSFIKVFEFYYLELIYDLSKTDEEKSAGERELSFYKHLFNEGEEYITEDISEFYRLITHPNGIYRNNTKLFAIHYPELAKDTEDLIFGIFSLKK